VNLALATQPLKTYIFLTELDAKVGRNCPKYIEIHIERELRFFAVVLFRSLYSIANLKCAALGGVKTEQDDNIRRVPLPFYSLYEYYVSS
jgi:hypothetical protein